MKDKHNISEEGDMYDLFDLCKEKQYESILQHFIDSGGGLDFDLKKDLKVRARQRK